MLTTYHGKKVLITGHTGFKGSWLTQWLLELGSKITGYALAPYSDPSLFEVLELEKQINSIIGDVNDYEKFSRAIQEAEPDIIFHLAAQPLVRYSYQHPLETIKTNVLGTVNLLEIVRTLNLHTNIVVITSDKCYENKEWMFGYRENDPMGGYDPYSASKGATEILTESYKKSFFPLSSYDKHQVHLASARAGNVIGGGDWSVDRIVPDTVKALTEGRPIEIRNPYSTRPWQHVLEPLSGYIKMGAELLNSNELASQSFNFGPLIFSNRSVQDLVSSIIDLWGSGEWKTIEGITQKHEAKLLNLTIDKAFHLLKWTPVWNFDTTIQETTSWYQNYYQNQNQIKAFTVKQIKRYQDQIKYI